MAYLHNHIKTNQECQTFEIRKSFNYSINSKRISVALKLQAKLYKKIKCASSIIRLFQESKLMKVCVIKSYNPKWKETCTLHWTEKKRPLESIEQSADHELTLLYES
jgi:hypothetical protein